MGELRAIRRESERLQRQANREAAQQALYAGYCARMSCRCHTDEAFKLTRASDWIHGPVYCCVGCARDDEGYPQPQIAWSDDEE